MRLHFSTGWIYQGWITHLIITICAQRVYSRPTCSNHQYFKDKRCCTKCEPGTYQFSECSGSSDTKCRPCGSNEYQPDWNNETKCLAQKFCDTGKGFDHVRPNNPRAAVPCQCKAGLQCSPINCEFCEKIPTCWPGYGLETDPESGRKTCVLCKRGFFSPDAAGEPCRLWTSCKGRSEKQAGSDRSDAVCGPPVSGASSSWVVVLVLSVITVLSLLILLLFCYKDKLKLLSVNLRSCVQNLKRTRIQQETLAPVYHSGGAGGGAGGGPDQSCTLCETTSLIRPDPPSPPLTSNTPAPLTSSTPALPLKLPLAESEGGQEESRGGLEDSERGQEGGSGVPALWALGPSCVCALQVREPLEVGENEDCSQAVSPGTLGPCYCGGAEGGERGDGQGGEGGTQPPTPPPRLASSSLPSAAGPPPDLCLPLTRRSEVTKEVTRHLVDGSPVKGGGLYRLSDSSDSSPTSEATPAPTSANLSAIAVSNGERYSEQSSEASSDEQDQGLSWRDSGGNKLSSGDAELECAPESLQSQLAETALTSGQVSGNHNTTFISSGQVMNFSGDVIVVYVSQTSLGCEGAGPDDAFRNPVQEQAGDSVPLLPSLSSKVPTMGGSVSHNPPQDDNLPVQEVTDDWPRDRK